MDFYQKKLFHQISYEQYRSMQTCLSAREAYFQAGQTICHFGEQKKQVGILAGGSALTVRYEPNGSRTILEHLNSQDIFGEVLSFQSALYESISIVCEKDCKVLFFDYGHMFHPCSKVCSCHQQLIQNMLQIISEKAILLSERVEILTKRTTREKLLCYFLQLSEKTGTLVIELPFTMVDLADYLSVDRSAMSRELKRIKEDGLLTMSRKKIKLVSLEKILNSMT